MDQKEKEEETVQEQKVQDGSSREERHRRAEGLEQPQRTPDQKEAERRKPGRPGRYEQQPVKPELPKKKHSRTPLIVAGIVVLIMVAVYLGFGVYYMDRFFPGRR